MKLNYTYAAAGVALLGLAYWFGKRNGSVVKAAQADANIQAPANWWNFPGQWTAS